MIEIVFALLLVQQERIVENAQCLKCHEEGDEFEAWKSSIHSKNSVGCFECHGGDTIDRAKKNNPHTREFRDRKRETMTVCGKCHKDEVEAYASGGHHEKLKGQPPWATREVASCIVCHNYHGTQVAEFVVIRKQCAECHAAGTPHHGSIDVFSNGLFGLRAEADRLEADLKAWIAGPGLSDRRAKKGLESARLAHASLRQAQHAVRQDVFARESGGALTTVQDTRADLKDQRGSRARRPLWLVAFLAVMLLNLALARRWSKRRYGH